VPAVPDPTPPATSAPGLSAARPPASGAPGGPDRPAAHGVSVVPPEARPFQGRYAGLVSRLLANTVDFAVVTLAVASGYAAVAALRFLWNSRTFSFPAPSFGLLLLAWTGLMVVYLACAWTVTGRTYGDHLLGLRVVGPRGRPPRAGGALVRAVFCVLFPIGLLWVAVSRDSRSAQDVVLRFSVVYDWAPRHHDAPDPGDGTGRS
jgi:uncharacterized RDD family membrane protein YckC